MGSIIIRQVPHYGVDWIIDTVPHEKPIQVPSDFSKRSDCLTFTQSDRLIRFYNISGDETFQIQK